MSPECGQPPVEDDLETIDVNCYWAPLDGKDPSKEASGCPCDCDKVHYPYESEIIDHGQDGYGDQSYRMVSGQYLDAIYSSEQDCGSCAVCLGDQEGCWPGPLDFNHNNLTNSGWFTWNWEGTGASESQGMYNWATMWNYMGDIQSAGNGVGDWFPDTGCYPGTFNDLESDAIPPITHWSDLVGLLCGWNSLTHNESKFRNDSSFKWALTAENCPLLFTGEHGGDENWSSCENAMGSRWKCLCAQYSEANPGSYLNGEAGCSVNTDVGGCNRDLAFNRLFMQYGKHPLYKFTLVECGSSKLDVSFGSFVPGPAPWKTFDVDATGFDINEYWPGGWRDNPFTYGGTTSRQDPVMLAPFPWLNPVTDDLKIGDNTSSDGNNARRYLPSLYLNGCPRRETTTDWVTDLGTPCNDSGLGDPEQTGVCLRRQGRAPFNYNRICCLDDYCQEVGGETTCPVPPLTFGGAP